MPRIITFGFVIVFLLLAACNSWLTNKGKETKPYYFSTIKNKPAYHQAKKKPRADSVQLSGSSTSVAVAAQNQPSTAQVPQKKSTSDTQNKSVKATEKEVKTAENPKISKAQKHARSNLKPSKDRTTNGWFLGGAALFTFLTASVFSLFIPKTKGLASWAKENKKAAQYTIAAGQVATGFGAYFMGRQLADFSIATTEAATYPLLAFAALAALAYPEKNRKSFVKYSYGRNKLITFLLLLSSFFLFLNIGNREVTDKDFNPTSKQISEAAGSNFYADWQENFSKKTTEKPQDFGHVLLDILKIVLGLMLAYIILAGTAVLYCSLACNGQAVAAAIVLIGGVSLTLFVFLGSIYLVIKGARKRKGKSSDSIQESNETERRKPVKKKAPNGEIKWF